MQAFKHKTCKLFPTLYYNKKFIFNKKNRTKNNTPR